MNFVSARASELSPAQVRSLAAYRHKVFIERLGWQLKTEPNYEQDQFDHSNSVHLIARNNAGGIVGYGRLLPTTESYLLESVFPELLNGLPVPRSDKVWELTRFAATEAIEHGGGTSGRRYYIAERMLLKALRTCRERGVTHLLAVSTLPVERLMQRAGVDVHRIGPSAMIANQRLLAFVIGVNDHSIDALSAFEAAAQGMLAKLIPIQRAMPGDTLKSLLEVTQEHLWGSFPQTATCHPTTSRTHALLASVASAPV